MSEAAHQHGKKKRKADPEIDPEFQIAPMIDILLVLLVFFMSISTTEVLKANKDVTLPVAKEAKDAKVFEVLTKKPVIADEEEQRRNPRSRSAKMRAAQKI